MKKRSLLFSFSVLPMVALIMVIAVSSNRERSYIPRGSMTDRAVTGAAEYWKTIRNNQITGEVDIQDVLNALKEINQMNSAKSLSWSWDEMGPDNLGGRTRAILFDKTNPNIMYAGAVSGGLWKSTTAGSSWVKVSSVADNMVIACIAQAPNGDIYVGTGEGFYTNTAGGIGVGTGTGGFQGAGIYKSTDGNTFTQLANTASWTYINELAVNQTNGYVYAATKVGLKISSDGGDNWSVTPTFSPTTSNMNADDINIGTDGTTILVMNKNAYVAADGVSFTKVTGTSPTYSMPAAGSRMEVAIAPSDPNYMYAVLAAANGTTQGVYRSINKGSTWTQIAPAATTTFDIHRNQGDYDNAIEVYPNNKNKIIVGGINIWTWSDGTTWTQITSGSFSETSPLYVHVDIH